MLVAELPLGMVWEDVMLVVPDLNQAVNYCNIYQCKKLHTRMGIFPVLFSFFKKVMIPEAILDLL